jgi:hypothetical protein
LPPSESLCVDDVEVGELPLEEGLAAFGGCGNEPTLIVFRNGRVPLGAGDGAFEPAGVAGMLDAEPTCFCLARPIDFGVGRPEDTLRGVAAGAASSEAPEEGRVADGVVGVLLTEPFLVRDIGRAGSGVFGGPNDGRDGRGSVVAMLRLCISRNTTASFAELVEIAAKALQSSACRSSSRTLNGSGRCYGSEQRLMG